jgi:hypothetical protein
VEGQKRTTLNINAKAAVGRIIEVVWAVYRASKVYEIPDPPFLEKGHRYCPYMMKYRANSIGR